MTLIIGIGHKKRSGKDLFASYLQEELLQYGRVTKRSFADPIKEIAYSIFSMYNLGDKDFYEKNPEERKAPLEGIGKTPRQLWIELGSAVRSIHEGVWIDMMFGFGNELHPPIAMIIPDVRFPKEVEAVKSRGGILIKVKRDSTDYVDDEADCALDDFNGWDYILLNNGDNKFALKLQAKRLAGEIYRKCLKNTQ